MDYVNLGRTGLKVSRLCLGCMSFGSSKWRSWVLDEDDAKPFFKAAVEAGINFFDTADVYSQGESERVTGAALKEYAKRHEVVIATKVNGPMGADANNRGLSRKHILDGIDQSLMRLGVDYVDLYQIHRFDYETPIEETLEALNDVVRAGKARYIGASSMYAWQFMKMLDVSKARGWTPFVSMQPQYNLVYREEEREMLPLCRGEGVGVIPWSPLARGFLAGGRAAPREGNTERARTDEFSPRLYYREPDFEVVKALDEVAKARGVSNMQVALAWVLRNPAITAPIVGTTKTHHLEDAVGALSVKLTDDEVKALEAAYQPKPVLDHG
ncbi:MAG TPA: aldo/keto reductase [Caulobacteraceae bacterium]|nr:aldo/keto reductase [Caulobacteraceae bacterium]